MSIKDGGPAFPQQTDITLAYDGMTLRDYFAGKAMQHFNWHQITYPNGETCFNVEQARQCYGIADAMLKAREEG